MTLKKQGGSLCIFKYSYIHIYIYRRVFIEQLTSIRSYVSSQNDKGSPPG